MNTFWEGNMGRLMIYEGSDEEIRKFLSSLPAHSTWANPVDAAPQPSGTGSSSHLDHIARSFRRLVDEAAANGREGQLNTMIAWLKAGGSIELSDLWPASGVKNRHDYGGIGSSLTRNMKRAGGMKHWYTWVRKDGTPDDWVYTIVPELVEPLKRAFDI